MAITLANVDVPVNVWTDLYAATGIHVGSAIAIQNIGAADVYLTVAASQPPADYDAYNVLKRDNGVWLRNSPGDPGAWVFCQNSVAKVSVRAI